MKKNLILAAGLVAISGIATAQTIFAASGNTGIGTITPAAGLQVIGTARLGSATNYTSIDVNGNIRFVGTAGLQIANNAYAFRAATNANIGLYFNAAGNAFEFRSATAAVMSSTGAATGNGFFLGNLGLGISTPAKKLEVRSGDVRLSLPSTTLDSNTAVEFVNSSAGVVDWKLEHYQNPLFDTGSLYIEYANDDFASDANLGIAAYYDAGDGFALDIKYWVLGAMYADTYYQASDERLKKDVKEFKSGLSIINQLKPKTYFYDSEKNKAMGLNKHLNYGFLAQDLEKVIPEMVSTQKALRTKDENGRHFEETKLVSNMTLIPILTQAMQEQQAQIEELRATVEKLTASISASQSDAVANVNISSATLGQNIPNPLKGVTSIRYNVPTGSSSAQLIITDNNGKTVKSMQLAKSGAGTVNIDASTLSAGTYNYSLLVDNKLVETKRMVITK